MTSSKRVKFRAVFSRLLNRGLATADVCSCCLSADVGNTTLQGNTSDGRSGVSHFPEMIGCMLAHEVRDDSTLDGLQHTRRVLEERCVESSHWSLLLPQESGDPRTSETAELAHQRYSLGASASEVAHEGKAYGKVQEKRRELEEPYVDLCEVCEVALEATVDWEVQEKKREIQKRCAETSRRCLALLQEVEKSGASTALELAHQRGRLRLTEHHHEVINVSLKKSKKDIRSWWREVKHSVVDKGKKFRLPKKSTSSDDKDTRGNDTGWFKRAMSSRRSKKRTPPQQPSPAQSVTFAASDSHLGLRLPGTSQPVTPNRTKTILERNLDDMITSVTFLRGLAEDLGQELDSQDQILSKLSANTENTISGIRHQTHKLNKLL